MTTHIAHANGTNGTHAPQNGTAPAQPDTQAWRDVVAVYTQRAHDHYGPDLAGRIEKARRIVLDGRVKPNGAYAHVESETEPETIYAVTNADCECRDWNAMAPQRMCKHRLAWQICRGAYWMARGQAMRQSEPVLSAEPSDDVLRIPSQFITNLHGKPFVTFAGLLAMAHERGLQSLDARFIDVQAEMATAIATARFADGRLFTECGDATPQNVGKNIAPHFARMALTRAKARALRDGLNIGMCSVEELGAD